MFLQSVVITIPAAIFCIVAWFTPVIHTSFAEYFTSRFGNTFSHLNDTSSSRFHILFELLIDVPITFALVVIILLTTWKKIPLLQGWREHKKLILFFIAVAATGILPLMITLEQRGFYLITALPYLAIAIALFANPGMNWLMQKVSSRKIISNSISIFSLILIAGSIIATIALAGKPKRDTVKLHDLALIAKTTGPGIILTSADIDCDWGLLVYGQRYYNLSFLYINDQKELPSNWLLMEQNDVPPADYHKVPITTEHYVLYRRNR
ncbi:hypothetical protein BH09BAC5_BH09BAC5_25920 [soil metagenome]